jgi:hypothetical protein
VSGVSARFDRKQSSGGWTRINTDKAVFYETDETDGVGFNDWRLADLIHFNDENNTSQMIYNQQYMNISPPGIFESSSPVLSIK